MGAGIDRRRAPKSNAQRQREFRARNPGYYRKYNARAKARRRAAKAMLRARTVAAAQAQAAPLFAELIMATLTPVGAPRPTTATTTEPALPLFDRPDADGPA